MCRALIFDPLIKNFNVVDLSTKNYRQAVKRTGGLNLRDRILYDAIRLQTALKKGCEVLVTFNVEDFWAFDNGTG